MTKNSFITWQLDKRPGIVIVLTLLALSFGMGLGTVFGTGLTHAMGVDVAHIMNSSEAKVLSVIERQGIRWFNFVAHLFAFTLAAILMAMLAKGDKNWKTFLQLDRFTSTQFVLLSILLLVALMPIIQFSNWLNYNLPLPEWMITMENNQNWLVGEVLRMESFSEFLVALTVAAIAPAVGEELLFRGVIQTQLQKLTQNPHLGIWLAAIIFSAIHLQFVGFLPRMLLGALLGYLLWWSGSLWLPILIHFLFNGVQVFGAYLYPEEFQVASQNTEIEMPAIWLTLLSVLAVVYLVRHLHQQREIRVEDTTSGSENGV